MDVYADVLPFAWFVGRSDISLRKWSAFWRVEMEENEDFEGDWFKESYYWLCKVKRAQIILWRLSRRYVHATRHMRFAQERENWEEVMFIHYETYYGELCKEIAKCS